VYLTDLPRNTSYLDLFELFEKKIGSCKIQIKRYTQIFTNLKFASIINFDD